MEDKPEEKLLYGTTPEESRLKTLANLCSVMNAHGLSIIDDPAKAAALLENVPHEEYGNKRKTLILALRDNIPQELLKSHHGFTRVNSSARLRMRLKEDHGIPDDLSRWAIETWAKALMMEK